MPLPAAEVEQRLAAMRARDRASALPPADTREGRQLRRWVAQVLVVERICEAEEAAHVEVADVEAGRAAGPSEPSRAASPPPVTHRAGAAGSAKPLSATSPSSADAAAAGSAKPLSATSPSSADAAAAGSVIAAAWAASPAVRRVADGVTRGVTLPAATLTRAARLAATDHGDQVWTPEDLVRSARMEEFTRWLARATHERVRLEPGYEHPGDARQPDHLHEH